MDMPDKDLVFVFDMAGVLVEWDEQVLFGPVFNQSGKDQEVLAIFLNTDFNLL